MMLAPALDRRTMLVPLAAAGCLLFGAMLGARPAIGLGLFGLLALTLLAFSMPATYLALVVFMTLIFPFSIQNRIGVGGGGVGLVFSDVVIMIGLAWAVVTLARRPLRAIEIAGIVATLALMVIAALQLYRGVFVLGHGFAEPGNDFRSLLGYGAFLMALPLALDPAQHPRLLRSMVAIGILLGLWGLVQWSGSLPYTDGGDFGVRAGVSHTSNGAGQLQGGLYGFPVAVTLGFAALLSGEIKDTATRVLLIAIVAVNGVCLFLTFERTFIVIAVFACGLVVLRAGHVQRMKALIYAPLALMCILVPIAVATPDSLVTARERLLSIGQYGSDHSVRYRVRESEETLEEIRLHPLTGSGLGAAIWWGRPANDVPPTLNWFIHNGYLWHAWKMGIPAAILLVASLLAAALRPGRPRGTPMFVAVVHGSQAIILGLLVASITFPAITSRTITPVLGILAALCLVPFERRQKQRAEQRA